MEKICFTCKISKPITEFYRNKQNSDRRQGNCKDCCYQYALNYRNKNKIINKQIGVDTSKLYTCSTCSQKKIHTEFYKNKSTSNGLDGQCKVCKKHYQQSNKEKRALKEKNNRLIKRQEYLEANKDEIAAHKKAAMERKKLRRRYYGIEGKKKWRQKYPDKEVKLQKKTLKKHVEELSDKYITELIRNSSSLKYKDIKKYPDLIETKRLELKINRMIKNHLSINP